MTEPRRASGLGARRVPAAVLRRSLSASLVVGTLLTVLNQGDLLLEGQFPPALWWKVPLTYLVPFLVATYGALGGNGGRTPPHRTQSDQQGESR